MKEFVLDNGLKFIYEKGTSMLTSISIALEAGASAECMLSEKLGVAHATEHMVFKGTKTRTEANINETLSKLFGFHNAMTNYPYVIYYGTLLGEDLDEGIEIFSDILINPIFPIEGFNEEMDSIKEELNEWDEELDQYCEDKLFIHSFKENRLKYPIIGTHEDLNRISLEDIKTFYESFYTPENTTIAIVSSLEFEEIKYFVEKYFNNWVGKKIYVSESDELPMCTLNKTIKDGINIARVEAIFSLANISEYDIKCLNIFNEFFGEGVNSILFNELRTKRGLVYDVITSICNEKHIRLYKITFNTSPEKVFEAINILKKCYSDIDSYKPVLTDEKINELTKSSKLKMYFKEEQGIRKANNMSTYNVMYDGNEVYKTLFYGLDNLNNEIILSSVKKVLKNPSIQIISPR